MQFLLLFVSSFIFVLLAGLQSLTVNRGHASMAAMVSFGIGLSNLYIISSIPKIELVSLDALFYLLGGPIGIVSAIYLNDWLKHKFPSQVQQTKQPD